MPMPTAAPTLTPEPPTPTKPLPTAVPEGEQAWEIDDSVMVHVPAGEFLMGSKEDDPDSSDNEHPQHTVYVSEFWIDKTEVTNVQYQLCVSAGACQPSLYADDSHYNGPQQPVVGVYWNDAITYCEWAGKRLPTEAEWEKAARGMDGRRYPWGDEFDCQRGNFDDETEDDDHVVPGGEGCDGYVRTAPVGSFASGASPYGALDMAGNVWEWCQDWYDNDYYASSSQRDPQGPSSGGMRVGRGGSWVANERGVRAADRFADDPDFCSGERGFRCVSQSPVEHDTPTPTPTAAPTLTPEPPTPNKAPPTAVPEREIVWEADDSVMVHVPAGEFLMGSPPGGSEANEHPQHTVYVSEFWIDKTEVTNDQYQKCVEARACLAPTACDYGEPTYSDSSKADHPVVCVSWQDARTYCEWAGRRLPTEAEWEKAARGTDERKYPWGNTWDASKANSGQAGPGDTTVVGSYPDGASPYGVLDMAGNVWEWCQDWYDEDYYANSPQRDPQGPSLGSGRVSRGGSWHLDARRVRAAFRGGYDPDGRNFLIGFRCVTQPP